MNRIFACSDLHGNYKVFQSILQKIDETDKVIILGDVVDRGEYGFQMLKEILSDKRFILIKGNHEDMFVDDMREFHRNEGRDECHAWNGGDPTFWAWREAGEDYSWIHTLNSLPDFYEYKNAKGQHLVLTHAGYTPPFDSECDDVLWERSHLRDDYNGFDEIIIHGHTPIPHQLGYKSSVAWRMAVENGPFWYCNNHKCNLDTGCFVTNITFLLDLDTFEAIKCEGEN